MTQNEKDLLFKDLCARLPYGVKVQTTYINPQTKERKDIGTDVLSTVEISLLIDGYYEPKPYLFPLSRMTEEQMEELCILCDWHDNKNDAKSILVLYQGQFVMNADVIDWFHENHFDYRGLIPMDLALDATNLNIY